MSVIHYPKAICNCVEENELSAKFVVEQNVVHFETLFEFSLYSKTLFVCLKTRLLWMKYYQCPEAQGGGIETVIKVDKERAEKEFFINNAFWKVLNESLDRP